MLRRTILVAALVATSVALVSAQDEADAIKMWLKGYDEAFVAKDLEKLATFYHPEVTIFEGGGVNRGWADYRDHHLGPELKQFQNLQFSHSNTIVRMLGRDTAYVTSEYSIKARKTGFTSNGEVVEVWLYPGHRLHQGHRHAADSMCRIVLISGRVAIVEPF